MQRTADAASRAGKARTTGSGTSAAPAQPLSRAELERYTRHLALPGVGLAGQERLRAARVLVVGAGGLGSPVVLYLAAAGVGALGLVDFDEVDVTNLQRQIVHGTSDVGRPKTESARDRIADINPHVQVALFDTPFRAANALEIARGYDVIVDGTDNFATRYLVNDAAVMLGVPNVYGSVARFEGQASVFGAKGGPCYRCLFREPPPEGLIPNCAEGGVFGVLPGLIGTIQATETLKLLLGVGDTLAGRLLLVNAMDMSFRTVSLQKDADCPACGNGARHVLTDSAETCSTGRGGSGVARPAARISHASPAEVARRIATGEPLQLVDVREPFEWDIARIAGARLIPLGSLRRELHTLNTAAEVVVYCHAGIRSMHAARELLDAGFERVTNMTGGISRWSDDVDPSVPRY